MSDESAELGERVVAGRLDPRVDLGAGVRRVAFEAGGDEIVLRIEASIQARFRDARLGDDLVDADGANPRW